MNKRLGLVISVMVLGIVMAAVPAMASQSFFGYSGLVHVPTTEVMGPGQVSLGAYFTNFDVGPNNTTFAATGSFFPNLEVGAGVSTFEHGDSEALFNAKYRFMSDTLVTPSLAVGAFDLGRGFDTSGYIVAGKALSTPSVGGSLPVVSASVYLGAAAGDFHGVFGGVTVGLGDKLTLMAEHDTDNINFGARLAIGDQFRLNGAVLDGNNFGLGVSFYTGF